MTHIYRPTRRAFLGASAAALLSDPGWARAAASAQFVDVHCHIFNGADVPVAGFLTHVIPLLSDVTDNVWTGPERFVGWLINLVRNDVINKITPDKATELAFIQGISSSAPATAIPPLNPSSYKKVLDQAASKLAAIPLLHLDPQNVRDTLERVIQLVNIAMHERSRIAATMATVYDEVDLFVPLLVDYDAWSNDKPETPLFDQIDLQAEIARASMRDAIGRKGARFHPFMAFDPLREVKQKMKGAEYRPYGDDRVFKPETKYALPSPGGPALPHPTANSGGIELVRYAVEKSGFIGVKVYPPVGFAPLDNEKLNADNHRLSDIPEAGKKLDLALRAFYAYCEAEEVPVTTHASTGNQYGLGFSDFVMPARWAPVLKEFPHLRLNLGHFGDDTGVDPQVGVAACAAWIRQAAALMNAYPNVFADMSCSQLVWDDVYAKAYLGHVKDVLARFPKAAKKVMYGSDFWLNHIDPNPDGFVKQFTSKLAASFGPAMRDDIMRTNALQFLGFLDECGKPSVSSRNATRLRSFYGATALPSWLSTT
jgi:predicted TIM-barrel fold metal-dependent hydrolase